MIATQPLLRIRNAAKSYGSQPALVDVSLDLFPGELLGFLGPNGAGKTTMFNCLAGRRRLDHGSIELSQDLPSRALPGVIPQNLALYDDLTATQNLRAFGRLHGVGRSELTARVTEALQWSDLFDRRSDLVRSFSGGMKRRLNIAAGVLHQPRIILLDEPTVGVDPQSRERIYEMLSDLRSRGAGILLATHHLEEAQHRCDRIVIIDHGKIAGAGTFAELVQQTVGHRQWVRVAFSAPPESVPRPLVLQSAGLTATAELLHPSSELPALMQQLLQMEVEHVAIESPTLQHVFLALTGGELRE